MSEKKGKGAAVAFLLANKDFAGDVCLPWPFTKNEYGYGHFGHLGKPHKAHRFMCELAPSLSGSPQIEPSGQISGDETA